MSPLRLNILCNAFFISILEQFIIVSYNCNYLINIISYNYFNISKSSLNIGIFNLLYLRKKETIFKKLVHILFIRKQYVIKLGKNI